MTRHFIRADSAHKPRCPECGSTGLKPRKLIPAVQCCKCGAVVMTRELVTQPELKPEPKRSGSGQIAGPTHARGTRWFT